MSRSVAGMVWLTALLLATGTATTPPPSGGATAVGVARARILSPAEVRRVDGRLVVTTGRRQAPTQVHRTARKDGGETADFY